MKKQELTELLLSVARNAYLEGKEHQLEDDFPDVGMCLSKTFKDTDIYRIIKEK